MVLGIFVGRAANKLVEKLDMEKNFNKTIADNALESFNDRFDLIHTFISSGYNVAFWQYDISFDTRFCNNCC